MPKYTIENTATGEMSEFWGSYDEMKAHVASDPDLRNVIGCPKIVSGVGRVSDGSGKLPDGFKDKLKEIKKKHPTSSGVDHLI